MGDELADIEMAEAEAFSPPVRNFREAILHPFSSSINPKGEPTAKKF
jgi:hypothetical protein